MRRACGRRYCMHVRYMCTSGMRTGATLPLSSFGTRPSTKPWYTSCRSDTQHVYKRRLGGLYPSPYPEPLIHTHTHLAMVYSLSELFLPASRRGARTAPAWWWC